jgi:hypothetical protein
MATVLLFLRGIRIMVRCEGARLGDKPWPNYAREEGWPLEVALQEEISNHRQRLGSKAPVVSVTGKGPARRGQVCARELNVSEPLTRCRKDRDVIETGVPKLSRDRVEREPVYWLHGGRHEGGRTRAQALAWNAGTFVAMVRENAERCPVRQKVPKRNKGRRLL